MKKIISQKLNKYNNLIQGVAIGDFGRLRFSDDHSQKNISRIIANRKKYCDIFKIDLKNVVMQDQVHETNITLITKKDRGRGVFSPKNYVEKNDGMITKDKNIFLTCFTADCLPVSFFDPRLQICGIAHSGWKGTLNNICGKMIERFNKLGSNTKDIIVYIGPAIGKCCYEVSRATDDRVKLFDELATKLESNDFIKKDKDKLYLNLKKMVEIELIESGIEKGNIEISNICTCCDKKFPSYYRDRKFKADLLSVIGMI